MPSHEKRIAEAREDLEKAALAYARMETFGFYLDGDGYSCRVCESDRLNQVKFLREALDQAAIVLLRAISSQDLPPRK